MTENNYSIPEILDLLDKAFDDVNEVCQPLDESSFSQITGAKWSVAQNLDHLILSAKPVASALNMPKITFLAFGKASKPSRTYQGVVAFYKEALANGGVSTSQYLPKDKPYDLDKQKLLESWMKIPVYFRQNTKNWNEKELDEKRIPHPLLGKLTFREMLYFTIGHTYHHLEAMKKATNRG